MKGTQPCLPVTAQQDVFPSSVQLRKGEKQGIAKEVGKAVRGSDKGALESIKGHGLGSQEEVKAEASYSLLDLLYLFSNSC